MQLIAVISFHNVATGPQAFLSFSKKFKHCHIVTFDGDDWVLIEFGGNGIKTRVLKAENGASIVERFKRMKSVEAVITIKVHERCFVPWFPLWGRTCTELVRYASGANIGKTFNPIHLYNKLLKYDGKRNYEILSHWMR